MHDFLKKSFLFLIFFLPWQLALNLGIGIDLASGRVLIALLFLAWLAFQLLRKKVSMPSDFVSISLYGFIFCMLFSIVFSREIEWSLRKASFLLSIFPIIFLTEYFLEGKDRREIILKVLVTSSFGVAFLGIIQFFSQFLFGWEAVYFFWADYISAPFLGRAFSEAVLQNPSWLVEISGRTWIRATAVFPDPHMLSFFLNLSIGANLALIIKNKKILFWRISLAVLVLASLLTFSRGGYVGFFLASLVISVIFFMKLRVPQKIRLTGILLGITIVLAAISPIRERFFSSFNLREGSNIGRLETWGKAWDVWERNFPLGVGIGSYPLFVKATADYREP
ncbi:MAG: O-antigen ligase family protein, partial [Patescibacteria group bacterium]